MGTWLPTQPPGPLQPFGSIPQRRVMYVHTYDNHNQESETKRIFSPHQPPPNLHVFHVGLRSPISPKPEDDCLSLTPFQTTGCVTAAECPLRLWVSIAILALLING